MHEWILMKPAYFNPLWMLCLLVQLLKKVKVSAKCDYSTIFLWFPTKPGLWILDVKWTVDWTLDSIMDPLQTAWTGFDPYLYIVVGHPQQAPLWWKWQLQGLLYSTGALWLTPSWLRGVADIVPVTMPLLKPRLLSAHFFLKFNVVWYIYIEIGNLYITIKHPMLTGWSTLQTQSSKYPILKYTQSLNHQ